MKQYINKENQTCIIQNCQGNIAFQPNIIFIDILNRPQDISWDSTAKMQEKKTVKLTVYVVKPIAT